MRKIYKNLTKFFVLLFLVLSCFSMNVFAEPSVATLSSYTGSVYVKKSGGEKKISAFKGMRLVKGDTIITGKKSSATLDIDKDKEVIIGDNTQLSITELSKEIAKNSSKSSFTLQAGKVWSNVKKKLDKDSKYQIKTSTAIAGVRGTKFYVSQENGETSIIVLEGSVLAEASLASKQPDGSYNIEKIEKIIEKNHQFQASASMEKEDEIIIEPLELESLDLFVLDSYRDSITESNPELLEELNKIIEKKEIEEENHIDTEAEEDDDEIIPKISYDPIVMPETPSYDDNTGSIPVQVPNYAPMATNLSINGNLEIGSILTGLYTYYDSENNPEGSPLYQWYRGNNIDGSDKSLIVGATNKEYMLSIEDINKYIFFQVTPSALSGTLTGQPTHCSSSSPIITRDTIAPVGTIFDIPPFGTSSLFIQFDEPLSEETLSIANPKDLIVDSYIKIPYPDGYENIKVKEILWKYDGTFIDTPLLIITLEQPLSLYSENYIEVKFNDGAIKDIYENINNNILVGNSINEQTAPTISGAESLAEDSINNAGTTLSITLGANQGSWVEDIVSDTSKLSNLYNNFYVDSNWDEWEKLKANFSAIRKDDYTLSLTLPAVSTYNIDKDQWVSLIIPGDLVSSNYSTLAMPFKIQATQAEQLIIETEFSSPVTGTGGSEGTSGTTRIEYLDNSNIYGTSKWQIKVLDYYDYENIAYDSVIDGAIDYVQGEDILAYPSQILLLLATDNEGRIKKFSFIYLSPDMISVPLPAVENLSFDNSDPDFKYVVIHGKALPSYEKLEVITIGSGIPDNNSPAEYELYQLYEGIHELTPLTNGITAPGDTIYYRLVNGVSNSPWVADGIATSQDKPVNSPSYPPLTFTVSDYSDTVKVKGTSGTRIAVIKNGYMLSPVTIDDSGMACISIDGGINNYDQIAVVILNENENIAARSDSIQAPSEMFNHIHNNRFIVLGDLGEIYINSTYKGQLNIFKNGVLNTSSSIENNVDMYIQVNEGLSSGDMIKVQLIDEFGNESDLSDQVIVMAAPVKNLIELNYGTAEEEDSITINNLNPYEYYKINILSSSGNHPSYEMLEGYAGANGKLGPIYFITSNLPEKNGTSGSTCQIYFIDFIGNTSPKSEIITAN